MTSASELYSAMLAAIEDCDCVRQSADPESPMQNPTREATFSSTFMLEKPWLNVPQNRPIDVKWAAANVLHFFARTEDAGILRKYNKYADRFLTGDKLLGAYGPIAVPQIERCIDLLTGSLYSRRAVVSMGELGTQDINRPPCWSLLHFLYQDYKLHMAVYQRSLNLTGVMPYDCVLLTNVLFYAAHRLNVVVGYLYWTVGSLHAAGQVPELKRNTVSSVVYSAETLRDPRLCMELLEAGL